MANDITPGNPGTRTAHPDLAGELGLTEPETADNPIGPVSAAGRCLYSFPVDLGPVLGQLPGYRAGHPENRIVIRVDTVSYTVTGNPGVNWFVNMGTAEPGTWPDWVPWDGTVHQCRTYIRNHCRVILGGILAGVLAPFVDRTPGINVCAWCTLHPHPDTPPNNPAATRGRS